VILRIGSAGKRIAGTHKIRMTPTCHPVRRRHMLVGALLAAAVTAWAGTPGFSTSISQVLVAQYVVRFGEAAQQRLLGWQGFFKARGAEAQQAERETALLAVVNRYFNRVRFLSDQSHWGVDDYWATPAEFFASDGGDCEDYSIAKYYALRELGVPISRLRITYVKSSKLNQAHMVLAYYPTPQAEPLILDNLEDEVRLASARPDLIPVYSFNDDDVLIAGRGAAGSPGQIRLWRELTDRLQREARV
jgi:predicted transglutaminase-like cysteine proteinase